MDFKTFLDHFDTIAQAPNGIAKLRSLILDLAVRGKLVPQNPEDESGKLVLEKINAVKQRIVKQAKTKRFKLANSVPIEERNLVLPYSWECAYLEGLIHPEYPISYGVLVPGADVEDGVPFVRVQDLDLHNPPEKPNKSIAKEVEAKYTRTRLVGGEILMAVVGSIGKLGFAPESWVGANIARAVCRILPIEGVDRDYLILVLQSQVIQGYFLEATRTLAQPTLNVGLVDKAQIPVPPISEQKRIVEKVDELMALCDRLQTSQENRDQLRQKLRGSAIASLTNAETDEELQKSWAIVCDNWHSLSQKPEDVNDLRRSVAQLAVRGKLIAQNTADESVLDLLVDIANQKKQFIEKTKIRDTLIPLLEDSDLPCEIPNTWTWKRFGDVILDIEAGASPQCEKRPKTGDEWGVIKISAVSWNSFNPDENKALPANLEPRKEFEIQSGDFIMSRANTSELVGKSVVVETTPPRLLLNDKTLRVAFPNCLEKKFFNLYNNSDLARQYYAGQGTGTSDSMKNITREQIRNLPIPLPPLAEQKRIVAKVDELMQMCDRLEESLRQSQKNAETFVASAIAHLQV